MKRAAAQSAATAITALSKKTEKQSKQPPPQKPEYITAPTFSSAFHFVFTLRFTQ
jgi:hypothetical protein